MVYLYAVLGVVLLLAVVCVAHSLYTRPPAELYPFDVHVNQLSLEPDGGPSLGPASGFGELDESGVSIKNDTATTRFPVHWGSPPLVQTKDVTTLPGAYGQGSTTLADWIMEWMLLDSVFEPSSNERTSWQLVLFDCPHEAVLQAATFHLVGVQPVLHKTGTPVTEDFRPKRLRIPYNADTKLVSRHTVMRLG